MDELTRLVSIGGTLAILGVGLLFVYLIFKTRYKKAGPDEALIVFGRKKLLGRSRVVGAEGENVGYRIVRGGDTSGFSRRCSL